MTSRAPQLISLSHTHHSQCLPTVPVEYVPEYMWQMVSENNMFTFNTDGITTKPGRRRRRALLHAKMAALGAEQYMGGRLLGGSSSINGEQAVWPTARLLRAVSAAAGGDPAWGPDAVFALLRDLETYAGTSPKPRGKAGPLDIKQAPANASADAMANDLLAALEAVFGPNGTSNSAGVPTVVDYNDPDTPLSLFAQWQLTQQPGGARASASTALLSPAVRARTNLVVATRATVMRVLFDVEGGGTPRARGVEYAQAGAGRVAHATREVILAAGHRSSLLLEASGVGDPDVIAPLLAAVGRAVISPLPGVGSNLCNDGIVLVTLNATGAASGAGRAGSPRPDPATLYGGGAFLPWPGSAPPPASPSLRFTQVIGAPHIMDAAFGGTPTLAIGVLVLNTTSRGTAHIQSADPLYAPLVNLDTFNDPTDQANWYYAIKQQVAPLVKSLEDAGYALLSPAPALLNGTSKSKILEWVFQSYIHSHHWCGTCAMGTDPGAGAVVDGAGRVYGVRGLRVADASIFPIKLDGNTGIPAYAAGGVVARKILEERQRV